MITARRYLVVEISKVVICMSEIILHYPFFICRMFILLCCEFTDSRHASVIFMGIPPNKNTLLFLKKQVYNIVQFIGYNITGCKHNSIIIILSQHIIIITLQLFSSFQCTLSHTTTYHIGHLLDIQFYIQFSLFPVISKFAT